MKEKIKEIIYPIYEKEIFSPIHGWPSRIRFVKLFLHLKKREKLNKRTYGSTYPNPFETIIINPSQVKRLSPRQKPSHKNCRWDLGTVDSFDTTPPSLDEYSEADLEDYYNVYFEGGTYSNSIFFKSMREHLVNNVPIEETEYYCSIKNSTQLDKNLNQLKKLKKVFESIKSEGYIKSDKLGRSFTKEVLDDIHVDIARDGEILLANSKHRLAIAKILGLEEIPAQVVVRHEKWQKTRENFNESSLPSNMPQNHPDIMKLKERFK